MYIWKRDILKNICNTLILISLTLSFLPGCSGGNKKNQIDVKDNSGQKENSAQKEEPGVVPEVTDSSENKIQKMIANMSLEEKVGQVFVMSLRYLPDTDAAVKMTDSIRKRIEDNHLGGVILFSENLKSISQTGKLISDMQSISKIPLFMAIDEEGGAQSRLNKSASLHSTKLPANRSIGKTGSAEYARKAASVIAEEISSLGFNMDFAPIADVDSNPKNPVIGARSFGPDQELDAKMVQAQVEEFQRQNIIAVMKHFPGHGDTATDSHSGAVVINNDIDRLRKVEFIPFQRGIQAGADGIMTAHIQVPKVTKNNLPATLSKEILTDILRNELNFKGVIITDALEMKAVSSFHTPDEAAVKAFDAGADILLMPYSIEIAYNGLLKAVREGRIQEKRLDESVTRILELKQKRGILEGKKSNLDPETTLGSKEHLDIANEIVKATKKK